MNHFGVKSFDILWLFRVFAMRSSADCLKRSPIGELTLKVSYGMMCIAGDRCQSVEFDYYNGKDTAVDLAREMVEDLNLTPEDAQAIVRAIAFEVARVKGGPFSRSLFLLLNSKGFEQWGFLC